MNLPLQSIGLEPVGAVVSLRHPAIRSPSITKMSFLNILPSAGLITVPPTREIFSACAAVAKIDSARASVILSFISKRFRDFARNDKIWGEHKLPAARPSLGSLPRCGGGSAEELCSE